MEVVERFLQQISTRSLSPEVTYLIDLHPHYPAQRTEFDAPPQARPWKHGVERALKSLVFQQPPQVPALVCGKSGPPLPLAVFVAILVILPDLAKDLAVGVRPFVLVLLGNSARTGAGEVCPYVSAVHTKMRHGARPSVYSLAIHH